MRGLTPLFHETLEEKRKYLMGKMHSRDFTKTKERQSSTVDWNEIVEISSESSADSTEVVVDIAPNLKLRKAFESQIRTNTAIKTRDQLPKEVLDAANRLKRRFEAKKW